MNVYLGPFLRIDKLRFYHDGSLEELTRGWLWSPNEELSKAFTIGLPNRGLPFDRKPMLTDDGVGITQLEEIDIEFEKAQFYARYKTAVEQIRKAVGDQTKAVVCFGYVIFHD